MTLEYDDVTLQRKHSEGKLSSRVYLLCGWNVHYTVAAFLLRTEKWTVLQVSATELSPPWLGELCFPPLSSSERTWQSPASPVSIGEHPISSEPFTLATQWWLQKPIDFVMNQQVRCILLLWSMHRALQYCIPSRKLKSWHLFLFEWLVTWVMKEFTKKKESNDEVYFPRVERARFCWSNTDPEERIALAFKE